MTVTALDIAAACRRRGIKTVAARADPYEGSDAAQAIELIFSDGQGHNPIEVARTVGCPVHMAQKYIVRQCRICRFEKVRHGVYRIVPRLDEIRATAAKEAI
jgi:hypothetical protein